MDDVKTKNSKAKITPVHHKFHKFPRNNFIEIVDVYHFLYF